MQAPAMEQVIFCGGAAVSRAAPAFVAACRPPLGGADRRPPLPPPGGPLRPLREQGRAPAAAGRRPSIRRGGRSTTPMGASSRSRSRSTPPRPCRRISRIRRRPPRRSPASSVSTRQAGAPLAARPRFRLGGAQARSAGRREDPRTGAPRHPLPPREQALLPDARAGGPGARLRRHRQPGLAGLELVYDKEISGKPGRAHPAARRPPRHGGRPRASRPPTPSRGTTST